MVRRQLGSNSLRTLSFADAGCCCNAPLVDDYDWKLLQNASLKLSVEVEQKVVAFKNAVTTCAVQTGVPSLPGAVAPR